jgi:hypothetical protein
MVFGVSRRVLGDSHEPRNTRTRRSGSAEATGTTSALCLKVKYHCNLTSSEIAKKASLHPD